MKFPVVPQSMRAVVVTVLALYFNQMGNLKARSDLLATSTEAMLRGEVLHGLHNQISSSTHSSVV